MTTPQKYRYLFGPVHSRRLGLSLGIDVVPMKTCTFNCIYCQLGRTSHQTLKRDEYVPVDDVMAELTAYLEQGGSADYLTFSGSGEPTLHSKLGEMIAQTKKMSKIPAAVLTCGALLFDPQVRKELLAADVVLPSLNAAFAKTFRLINRPHGQLQFAEIFDGLRRFRREYRGKIWLEVMLVKGINDNANEIAALRTAIGEIKPDKVHLNTVVRPPSEIEAKALTAAELRAIQNVLGPPAEVIAERAVVSKPASEKYLMDEIAELLARHPVTLDEIAAQANNEPQKVGSVLQTLLETGAIEIRWHEGKKFFIAKQPEPI
jgi:wyosine [tRNA(Phe)-imidazoG37] synthetase (radical SAM superfamily)